MREPQLDISYPQKKLQYLKWVIPNLVVGLKGPKGTPKQVTVLKATGCCSP